ncbi:uncharacterized protein LAESUDRAFT_710333 [Laetiporus sulphureus 93-53]|uniref:Calcineurin-like phosphoesterase domain-containing protein n=1 Tax=Laetiporus sulphureus 93-53 TaxID=1314785 RepID=A0A165HI04_9APHY|nr:uncharacterized protein LAESUDRAFT_710333 [Laetiporus sulphureus 93-53]KZT11756.1 hypothetical protein LAESUDRAFT_710333 [Laetiporus sulphureus 93-53]
MFHKPWYTESLAGDFCAPAITKEAYACKEKWFRVPCNINVQSGLISLRRTRWHDVPIVSELRILPENEAPPLSADWHKVSRTISSSGEKLTLAQMIMTGRQTDLITVLDVLLGDDQLWCGFEKLGTPVLEGGDHSARERLAHIPSTRETGPALLGVGRDTPLAPCSNSDDLVNMLLGRMLDAERQGLVVFTGDQLNGQCTSWNARFVLAEFAKVVTQRGIPWAAVFGNHDDEDGDSRDDQIKHMQGMPYSLVEAVPKTSATSYSRSSADVYMTYLLTLYFLNWLVLERVLQLVQIFVPTEYKWIHRVSFTSQAQGVVYISPYAQPSWDQIDWFLQESCEVLLLEDFFEYTDIAYSIDPIERTFTPDGGKDLGNIWERQAVDQVTLETRRLAKPNALVIYHIPTYAAAGTDSDTGKPLDVGQHDLEGQGSREKQAGFCHKGLLQAPESDHVAAGNAREAKVVTITENCRRVKGMWMCFGGGGQVPSLNLAENFQCPHLSFCRSYSGYGRMGFNCRFRLFNVSDYGETIRTYKHTENDEIVDEMVLAGRGAPPPFGGFL